MLQVEMSSTMPAWPEIQPPRDLPSSAFSELEEHGGRVIWGEGNPQAQLMIILDNPGARESKEGVPFVCPTRVVLRKALQEADLATGEVYITYLLKRRPTRAYDRAKAWAAYYPLLERQVRDANPAALVLAGNVVARALLEPGAEVKSLRGRLLQVFSHPAVVTYHPLAADRRPNLFPFLVKDFELIKEALASS